MYFLSITNKMQRYTMFFITVNALHVSGGYSTHRKELKTVHRALGICQACLLATACSSSKHTPGFSAHHQELKTVHTALEMCRACLLLPLAAAASKYLMLCVQF